MINHNEFDKNNPLGECAILINETFDEIDNIFNHVIKKAETLGNEEILLEISEFKKVVYFNSINLLFKILKDFKFKFPN